MNEPRALPTENVTPETVRTDQELAAKLRGQLTAVLVTLQQIQEREYHISTELYSDDCDRWHYRLTMSKTSYL